MAGETRAADESLFLDTSLLIAATVGVHPGHGHASAFVDGEIAQGTQLCISPQICREFLVVLTRQPASGRIFTLDEALASLDVWRTGCVVLDENQAVLEECLDLIRRYRVQGKQVHDCNIVATMRVHGVSRLATRNAADFLRFGDLIRVEDVTRAASGP